MNLSVADAARSRAPRYPVRPRSAATVSSGAATVFEALMSESFPGVLLAILSFVRLRGRKEDA